MTLPVCRNISKAARIGVSASPLVYFLYARFAHIPNYDSIGILPYKDAAAWNLCAKSLSLTGSFPDGIGNWCNRRPFFAELSGLLFRLSGGSDFIVLLIFTLLFCISLSLLISELNGLIDARSQVVIITLSLLIWFLFGANLFLSESLAIPMGLIFTTMILKFARTQNIWSLSCAAFTISLLQNTRPSNFFLVLVPLFVLANFKKIKQGIILITFSTISPYFLMYLAGKIIRIPEYNNSGNAWATLYGLIRKNSDWTLAYSELSQLTPNSDYEFSMRIKDSVLDNLRDDPFQTVINFVFSLVSNLRYMLISDHLFFLPDNLAIPVVGNLVSILFFLFIAWRLIKLKKSSADFGFFAIALLVASTTIFSYATFWKSEASRVLAPTLIFFITFLLKSTTCSVKAIPIAIRNKYSIRIALIIIGVIALGIISIDSNHSDRNLLAKKPSLSCPAGKFYFLKNSITTQPIKRIKFYGLFEWEKNVKQLGNGYLNQGLGIFGTDIKSVQTYSQVKLSPNRCYAYTSSNAEFPGLIKLGFGYID